MTAKIFTVVATKPRRRAPVLIQVDLPALIAADEDLAAAHAKHMADGYRLVGRRKTLKLRQDGTLVVRISWRKTFDDDTTMTLHDYRTYRAR